MIEKTVVVLHGDDDCEKLLSVPRITQPECAINSVTLLFFCLFGWDFFPWLLSFSGTVLAQCLTWVASRSAGFILSPY